MKIYSMNLSDDLSVNHPLGQRGRHSPPPGERYSWTVRGIFLYWFSIWFEKYSVAHLEKNWTINIQNQNHFQNGFHFGLEKFLYWVWEKSDTKILESGYENIFHEFIGWFISQFVGQPPFGTEGAALRPIGPEVFLKTSDNFLYWVWEIFCYPPPEKERWKLNPKWKWIWFEKIFLQIEYKDF